MHRKGHADDISFLTEVSYPIPKLRSPDGISVSVFEPEGIPMHAFFSNIKQLQWDDYRYYHQCRINQTLHLVSAISFLVAYALLLVDPSAAGLVGWLVGMVTRQSGHIFFEPRGYDAINNASYAHKESIKVGFNMRRKSILIGIWLALPALLLASPNLFGLIHPGGFWHDVGLLWLALGLAGLLFRTLHLFVLRSPAWGLAWASKILLDPFHNIAEFWDSPIALLHGERFDPVIEDV
jgi:hypothetical protein